MEVLAETPEQLKSLVETLGPARMKESYAPGKWTLNTVLCHLADCELTFGYRWRQVVAQPHHTVQTVRSRCVVHELCRFGRNSGAGGLLRESFLERKLAAVVEPGSISQACFASRTRRTDIAPAACK